MAQENQISPRQHLARIVFFFPFQLVFMHCKRSLMLIISWGILFGFVTQGLGYRYGIPHLFLYPEYLGQVSFLSHIVLGFCCGSFIMAFNIASYTINGTEFPFIATLSRPFIKYCINNFIIPFVFVLTYLYYLVVFQMNVELIDGIKVFRHVIGFISGNLLFIFISLLYFFRTNKSIFHLFDFKDQKTTQVKMKPASGMFHKKGKWKIFNRYGRWRIETYLSSFGNISLARQSRHYDNEMLEKVFSQNHINASVFELFVLASIIVLGLFREQAAFAIPAGAVVFLVFTMFLMLFSALHSWLKGWSTTLLIVFFLLLNQFSTYEKFNYTNYVYGLNYQTEKADYSNATLKKLRDDEVQQRLDFESTIEVLNKWKAKNATAAQTKPKLVILNCSGGGLRSSMWTTHSLLYADSILGGKLLRHTQMITGSSGGMLGAAYIRELMDKYGNSPELYNRKHALNSGLDLLNPVTFTIATNDMFIRFQELKDGPYRYTKDRGYSFEKQLNENTEWLLNKRLSDYVEPERNSQIPTIIMAPIIANDGRRLIIASQPVSYLCNNLPGRSVKNNPLVESVEFTRLFEKQNAMNLKFTSALRMNATFPYILPNAGLPSEPLITVMDAGLRDNYGIETTMKYIHTFRDWIKKNTSGVIVIEIRDKFKEFPIKKRNLRTKIEALITPIGSLYGNLTNLHSYHNDNLIQYASAWFDFPLDVISFQLKNEEKQRISLSWHLTEKEKKQVLSAVDLPENKAAITRLIGLIE